jgi:hypothetical protein
MKWFSFVFFFALSFGVALAQTIPQYSPASDPRIKALIAQDARRSAAEQKMSSALLHVLAASQGKPVLVPVPQPFVASAGHVRILIRGTIGDDLKAFLATEGATQIADVDQYGILSATLPIVNVEAVAARADVRSLELAEPPELNQVPLGEQNGGGYEAHGVSDAARKYGADGSGVTVCVMSDSVDHLADAQARGWLGPVDVLIGQGNINPNPGTPGTAGYLPGHTGEGTAMLEIIHSIAPKAALRFATSFPDQVTAISNIITMTAGGPAAPPFTHYCDIVADDIEYENEPPFQDDGYGTISRAVDDASRRGILWFTSAGNQGNKQSGWSGTWEGDFQGGAPDPQSGNSGLLFAPGVQFNPIGFASDGAVKATDQQAILWWDDPPGAATNQYILVVEDANYNPVAIGDTTMNGSQDPVQYALLPPSAAYLAIVKAGGAQPRFLHLELTSGAKIQYSTDGAIVGHEASSEENVFSVGAVSALGRTTAFALGGGITLDNYSADGPRRLFYNRQGAPITPDLSSRGGRLVQKPDLLAADCVNTDITGPPVPIRPFCGTSAAAAEAAGVAALVLSRPPKPGVQFATRPGPAGMRFVLTSAALDIEGAGWHEATGYGVVMPEPAFELTNAQLGYPPPTQTYTGRLTIVRNPNHPEIYTFHLTVPGLASDVLISECGTVTPAAMIQLVNQRVTMTGTQPFSQNGGFCPTSVAPA